MCVLIVLLYVCATSSARHCSSRFAAVVRGHIYSSSIRTRVHIPRVHASGHIWGHICSSGIRTRVHIPQVHATAQVASPHHSGWESQHVSVFVLLYQPHTTISVSGTKVQILSLRGIIRAEGASMCQYLSFCTSKASKLSTCGSNTCSSMRTPVFSSMRALDV